MSFDHVATQIVVVSLPILVGWVAHKLDMMDGEFDTQLSRIVLNICLPCSILASLGSSGGLPSRAEALSIIGGEIVVLGCAVALAYIVTAAMRPAPGTAGAYQFTITFSNCSLIGFPIISAILGPEAILVAAIALIPVNIAVFTLGVMMFSKTEGDLKKRMRDLVACMKSPTLLASVAVFICTLAGIEGFGVLDDSLSIVGALTTPAALLLTGSSLANYRLREMLGNWRAYIAAGTRLVVAPLAGLFALRTLGLEPAIVAILVLEGAMPVGTNGILYSLQYGTDAKPMMQSTFLSVVGAIATIPFITLVACA